MLLFIDGSGKLYGIDISEASLKTANVTLEREIEHGKVKLHLGSVMSMSYKDNMYGCVFHTNSYYFWPDLSKGVQEIHRVLKPEGKMVCTLRYKFVKGHKKFRPILFCAKTVNSDVYMDVVRKNGFRDVYMENMKGFPQVIHATAKHSSE